MNFTIQKLEFYDLQQKLLLTHTFDAPIRIRNSDLTLTLEGLVNLENPKVSAALVSKTYFKVEQENSVSEFVFEKNYQTGGVFVIQDAERKDEALAGILTKMLGVDINGNWQDRVIDLRHDQRELMTIIEEVDKNNAPIAELEKELDEIKQKLEKTAGLSPEEASKQKRINEVEARLKKLEQEVEGYQNEKKKRDALNAKVTKGEQELKSFEEKLASVDTLLEAKQKIETGIQKFSAVLPDPDVESKARSIKLSRVEKYLQALMSFRPKSQTEMIQDESKPINITIAGKEVLVLLALQIIATIILFIATLQARFIAIGFVASLVLVILFILINISKDKDELAKLNELKLVDLESEKESLLINTDPKENAFLINVAWLNALKLELKSIDAMIASRFGDQTHTHVQAERDSVVAELEETKKELVELDVNTLSSEEYYKKRRELDILKIEKENLDLKAQSEGKAQSDDSATRAELEKTLADYEAQLASAQKVFPNLPYIILSADSSAISIPKGERQLIHIRVVD